VKNLAEEIGLKDLWDPMCQFTWRRPNTDVMSCIDRFLYNGESSEIISRATNWSLSFSDHAAIEIKLSSKKSPPRSRSKIVRLDTG